MPYILVEGCDTTRMMQQVNIRAEVVFRGDVYKQNRDKCDRMMEQLKKDFEDVLAKYYNIHSCPEGEILSNHDYNLMMSFH